MVVTNPLPWLLLSVVSSVTLAEHGFTFSSSKDVTAENHHGASWKLQSDDSFFMVAIWDVSWFSGCLGCTRLVLHCSSFSVSEAYKLQCLLACCCVDVRSGVTALHHLTVKGQYTDLVGRAFHKRTPGVYALLSYHSCWAAGKKSEWAFWTISIQDYLK